MFWRGYPQRTQEIMTEDQFLRLIQALPRVELLLLDIPFRITGSEFRNLANSCPRLAILKLFKTQLYFFLESLAEAPPLQVFKIIDLGSVWFDNSN
jgi:hypothetical protein